MNSTSFLLEETIIADTKKLVVDDSVLSPQEKSTPQSDLTLKEKELQDLKDKMQVLKSHHSDVTIRVAEAEKELCNKTSEVAALQAEKAALQAANVSLLTDKNLLKERVTNLMKARVEYKEKWDKIDEYKVEIRKLNNKVAVFEKKVSELLEDRADQDIEIDNHLEKILNLTAQLTRLESIQCDCYKGEETPSNTSELFS